MKLIDRINIYMYAMDHNPNHGEGGRFSESAEGSSERANAASANAHKISAEAKKTGDKRYVREAHAEAARLHQIAAKANGENTYKGIMHTTLAANHLARATK